MFALNISIKREDCNMKEIMDKRDLAATLGLSVKRIENLINRRECDKLPPMLPREPGQKWYWAGRAVERWLEVQSELSLHIPVSAHVPSTLVEKRGRGRPRKVA